MKQVITDSTYIRFSIRNLKIAGIFLISYMAWLTAFVGIRPDHLIFTAFLMIMFFSTKSSRNILLGFGFFILYWIIYDSMRVLPNYKINPVHILEPFHLEKSLFGINSDAGILIPGEYLMTKSSDTLSLISGIFYLTWVPLPLLFALYLFFKDKRLLIHFSFAFLLTNLIGFVVYYIYPAAPPWYYLIHGESIDYNVPGNAAQLLNFDKLVGVPIFENMYNKNANVFAAIPSLHAAYPIILFYFGIKKKVNWMSVLFLIDILGIWFAAVYSLHHYIIDLLLGAMCAIFSIFVYELVFNRVGKTSFLDTYSKIIR